MMKGNPTAPVRANEASRARSKWAPRPLTLHTATVVVDDVASLGRPRRTATPKEVDILSQALQAVRKFESAPRALVPEVAVVKPKRNRAPQPPAPQPEPPKQEAPIAQAPMPETPMPKAPVVEPPKPIAPTPKQESKPKPTRTPNAERRTPPPAPKSPKASKPAAPIQPILAPPPTPEPVPATRPKNVKGGVKLFVARGGSPRTAADYELGFRTRPEAVGFMVNQHGLTVEEGRKLAKEGKLKLRREWHGADACAIREQAVAPEDVGRALTGELFAEATSPKRP